MSEQDAKVVALVPVVDSAVTQRPFGGTSAVGHTVDRLLRCERLDGIALLHDDTLDEAGRSALAQLGDGKVRIIATQNPLLDAGRPRRMTARAFSQTAWRGGLGGATCYDEILAAAAMGEAMDQLDATAGLLVGADWVLVDPTLCDAVIARHASGPERLPLVFTQAPMGLVGCVVARSLMTKLSEAGAMIGSALEYSVSRPQVDPIGKDPCVQIEPSVRGAGLNAGGVRVVCDGGRWGAMLQAVAQEAEADAAGPLMTMGAEQLADRLDRAARVATAFGPRQVTLELTPHRQANGPIVPQHHLSFDREPMSPAEAERAVQQVAALGDAALTLGGLGDALLHDGWEDVVAAAKAAGVPAVQIETDLLCDQAVLDRLLHSDVDVLSVRINADSAATYEKLMGIDGFDTVLDNVQHLLNEKRRLERALPWIAPRMVKVPENLAELEPFFDRWMYFCGQAVIEGPQTGCGSMPDQNVVQMAGPRRKPCRQLHARMTIHSDGAAALCDQDWRGEAGPPARPVEGGVGDAWNGLGAVRERHEAGQAESHAMCGACMEWHRP